MTCESPIFLPRSHRTVLPGWRAPSGRQPALRDCSLVVPSSGRPERVERLLKALLAVPDAPGEVVIVDADPSHALGALLRAWSDRAAAPFALVYVASPPGLPRQRNIGVDIATLDFIFFLDPDIEPLPGYFAVVRHVFDLDRDGCLGGVAGVVVKHARRRFLPRLRGRPDPLQYRRSGALPRRDVALFSGLRRVDVLPGCASAWRRGVFAAQRFSCFFGACPDGEDVEMSLRVGRSWALLCCGEARVRRMPAASAEPLPGYDAGRARIRNRYFIWKRHVSHPEPRHVARFWLSAVVDSVASLASFCLRPWQLARARHAAGMFAGIVSCLADPPRFADPPARREYVLAAETSAARPETEKSPPPFSALLRSRETSL